mmetsp:Transcript_41261/g.94952  ORF Transcript_41261/g.94952 Transcript_41261/m.94952 type:complete len:328 (+) Transcript_41261:54-1037(+)
MAPPAMHQVQVLQAQRVRAGRTSVLGDITNFGANSTYLQPAAGFKPELTDDVCCRGLPVDAMLVDLASLRHAEDPQWVQDYAYDIHQLLLEEKFSRPRPEYMGAQLEVNAKMRGILVDWIIEVHLKYVMRLETLYLTVQLIDRYLERRQVQRKSLQLVGVTAMLIASKYEEVYPPEISQFVYISDKACSGQDIVNMEIDMLQKLGFRVCQPTAADFFEQYQTANGCGAAHRELVAYLLELTLLDLHMIRHAPFVLVAAAIYLSNKLLRHEPVWPDALLRRTGLGELALTVPAREICALYEAAETNPLQAVRKKYSQEKHHSVAKLRF